MTMKASGAGDEPREIDRWDGGVGWLAHPDESMRRASHALAVDGEVWVVDPVDAAGVDDRLAEFGTVRGTVVLLDRHKRDAAEIARRHDAPVYVPAWMDGVAADLDAPVERFDRELPETGYRVRRVVDWPIWQEAALFDGETLVVPEAVGTAPYERTGGERLGVHPALRLLPPRRALGGLSPERIVVGHGEGIFEDAPGALADALRGARRRAPHLYADTARRMLLG